MGFVPHFGSIKAALASAANLSRSLDLPRPGLERTADDELAPRGAPGQGLGQEAPIAVRACLRAAGIDPDGEDAELLYAWATEADGAQQEDDVLAETAPPRQAEEARRRSAAREARLLALRQAIREKLREHGLLRGAPRMISVGYRVHEDGEGRRARVVVLDPAPGDATVYRGALAAEEAAAVVAGIRVGPVVRVEVQALQVYPHAELRGRYLEDWAGGRWGVLGELDAELADELRCTARHARRVREAWGIAGSRGRRPTVYPGQRSEGEC